jgi:acetyltransferase-like isoleucine patch superfamily enzyme
VVLVSRSGRKTYVNPNSTLTYIGHIGIGSYCAIAWNVNVLDFNGHDLTIDGIPRSKSKPVHIGDNVWIGTGVTVLPGVTIGSGAVVAAPASSLPTYPVGVSWLATRLACRARTCPGPYNTGTLTSR